MLIAQSSRNLYDDIDARWKSLQAWLSATVNKSAADKVKKSIDTFYQHWKEVDHGLLSDPDEICGAALDLETAENYAIEQGYPKPPTHGVVRTESCSVQAARQTVETVGNVAVAPGAGTTALAASDYCDQHPKDSACTLTAPKPLFGPDAPSWCQRAGMSDLTCDKDGLRPWFTYTLAAAGVAAVGGLLYASYQAAKVAAPFALAYAAPQALPMYSALQAGRHDDVKAQVLKALEEEGAKQRAVSVPRPSTARTLVSPGNEDKSEGGTEAVLSRAEQGKPWTTLAIEDRKALESALSRQDPNGTTGRRIRHALAVHDLANGYQPEPEFRWLVDVPAADRAYPRAYQHADRAKTLVLRR